MLELSDKDLKSYGDALVGIDAQSLANDPLARAINKMSEKEKERLADLICLAADKALEYYRHKRKNNYNNE